MGVEKVLVMGASNNPARYAWLATQMLKDYGHEVVCYGKKQGLCAGVEILNQFPDNQQFDAVTLYLNPQNQESYYEKIIALNPKRVIFNPGTENSLFEEMLEYNKIQVEEACTLVLLRTGQW